MGGEFVRFHVSYYGRLGVQVGIFVAVDHLRRAESLTAKEVRLYLDIDDWFRSELPAPEFYEDGNSLGAVTWFKEPLPPAMATRIDLLCQILDEHRVSHVQSRSLDPGKIIYEDGFQVGIVPYKRKLPTPLPKGVTLGPTTAGSKRGFH